MKFVFLLCLLLGCALAQDGNTAVVGQWSGTTEGGRTFFPPNPASSTCAPVVDPRSYVVINSTFSTAGVRQVVLLAEPAFKPFVSVLLYNGPFDAANACTNFVRTLTNQNFLQASVGTIDDPLYFAAGTTYYFVITSLNANVGKFSLQIFGTLLSGTSAGGPSWNPANLNNGSCVPTPGVTQSLSTVTWTQTATGDFDLLAMFEAGSTSTSPSVYFALYEGSFTTANISTNPCAGSLFTAIKIAGQEGDRAVPAYQFHLDINKIYTLAISNTYTGNWGFQVLQSRLKRVNGLSGYGQPNRGVTSCAANSTATNAGYFVQTFQAQYSLYFIDTYTIPSYVTLWADFPTYTFAYSGSNSATPPGTCPGSTFIGSAATGTTGGPLVLRTTVGSTYTVVVSTASGSSLTNANAAVQFYIFTGVSVGNSSFINPTTTGISVTTSTSGTGVSSTGTTTSKNATSTSTSSTGSTTLTSGASHTTIFYIFSILSGLLFLLL